MVNAWRRIAAGTRRVFRLVVLFCVVRLVAGVAAIALFDRGAVAWSYQLTAVIAAALVVYVLVALALRQARVT